MKGALLKIRKRRAAAKPNEKPTTANVRPSLGALSTMRSKKLDAFGNTRCKKPCGGFDVLECCNSLRTREVAEEFFEVDIPAAKMAKVNAHKMRKLRMANCIW